MIDNFALALSHGLMILAAWRLMRRPDLDDDNVPPSPPTAGSGRGFTKKAAETQTGA